MSRTLKGEAMTEARPLVIEGKTKSIYAHLENLDLVIIESKDDITAGDGAKHDVLNGKGALSTTTTCNVFGLLRDCGIPVAFREQIDDITFSADRCEMLPYEVVVRRKALGSFLNRRPDLEKGHLFPGLVLEFFLKTKGKKWKTYELPCDDPLMRFNWVDGKIDLFKPCDVNLPQMPAMPFLTMDQGEVLTRPDERMLLEKMGQIAKKAFLILEKAWQLIDLSLVDYKVEFGINRKNRLLLADVIDNDSWRLILPEGEHLDKQFYREGGELAKVQENFESVARLTERFRLPKQRLVIWRGSEKDSVSSLEDAFNKVMQNIQSGCRHTIITCSVHKQPERAVQILRRLVSEIPDTVIIAFIGRSNGAGPTLSAATTAPVVTVPANYKEFPRDVWSSLRTPSNVPVATSLEPVNAVLAALQILAMRNPAIYAELQMTLEARMSAE